MPQSEPASDALINYENVLYQALQRQEITDAEYDQALINFIDDMLGKDE